MSWRKAATAVLLAVAVLAGCSASSAPAAPAATPGDQVLQPAWTPVQDPDGYTEYLAQVCYQGNYLILAYGSRHVYGSAAISASYGGKCSA